MVTTGQTVFMMGAALLVLTVILAIVFLIRRPKYHPGSAAAGGSNGATHPLRSGYPTDPLTIRREARRSAAGQETEKLPTSGIVQGPPGTMALGVDPAGQATERLAAAEGSVGTEVLKPTEALATADVPGMTGQQNGTEKLNWL